MDVVTVPGGNTETLRMEILADNLNPETSLRSDFLH